MEFPPTKLFTISHPIHFTCFQLLRVVDVARKQCMLKKPFGRLVFRGVALPVGIKKAEGIGW